MGNQHKRQPHHLDAEEKFCRWTKELALMGYSRQHLQELADVTLYELDEQLKERQKKMTSPRYALGESISIHVVRKEANFDRACDEAYNRAADAFGVDEDGHITNVRDSARACDCITVTFQRYEHIAGMSGHDHLYAFVVRVVRNFFEDQHDLTRIHPQEPRRDRRGD